VVVDILPGAAEAGERLKRTALRDFGPPGADPHENETSFRLTIHPNDAPLPGLYRYALALIGLEAHGPGEKVAWWVDFTYKGERCTLAFQKFGLRIYLRTERSEEEAGKTLGEVSKKLRTCMRTVEKVLLEAAPDILGRGSATVVNQHRSLRSAYDYFRERAENPAHVEDEHETGRGEFGTWSSFKSGKLQMQMGSFHDMVATISAYLSLLEHVLVLSLAFRDFDPDNDDLTKVIGSRWGEKWGRLLGNDEVAARYRQQLTEVVERWRNPYSHGGFEKGHTATLWLHAPGVGALPVGMTNVRNSPHFSFMPASETDIAEVFALFDELDAWLKSELHDAFQWIESGLDVRFDENFRAMAAEAQKLNDFGSFLDYHAYQQAMHDNMDY
jgi:hypothetical protein